MVRKLNVWLFVTVLFIIEVSGSKSSDLTSLADDIDDYDLESDSVTDESEYWDLLIKLNKINPLFGDDGPVPENDEKWKEIDNLEWIDSDEDNGLESEKSEDIDIESEKTLNEINPLLGDDLHVLGYDEKWKEIDNLEWIDSAEDNGLESEKTLNEINPLLGDDLRVLGYDEKWEEIDNLEWADSAENNGLEILQMQQSFEVAGQRQFKFGNRAYGDRVVAIDGRNLTYTRMQDIKTNMTYPKSGIGRRLTYITIDVNQTSNFGQAYVIRGGIGKNFIGIIVEAYRTLYFNYRATFYGK